MSEDLIGIPYLWDLLHIFTHCARAYFDNQGDFSNFQYGLDLLSGLVSVCKAIKEKANAEKRLNIPGDSQIFEILSLVL